MQLLSNSLKRLVVNKKQSLYSLIIIAIAVCVPVLFVSVVLSFAGASFVELVNLSGILNVYTNNTDNALYKLCSAVSIIGLIIGALIILVYFIKLVANRKNEIKSFYLMGASFGQVATMVWLENFVILLVGIILGAGLSFILGYFIGLIYSVNIILNFDILLITGLIYLALTTIISIVKPLWVTTGVN